MCGAYGLSVRSIQNFIDRYDIVNFLDNFKPRWNIRPGQSNPVIVNQGNNEVELMVWGLLPYFAADEQYKYKTINAKAETVDTLPAFRHSFVKKRCLIPATGFYEPDKVNFAKQPYPWHYFRMKDDSIFSFAGLYDIWKDKGSGKEIHSYSIITTTPNEVVGKYHDRMPVILDREAEEIWLSPDIDEAGQLRPLLKPFPGDRLEEWQVGAAARNPINDYPEVIEPVKGSRQGTLF
ncbi:SOS response-associated peptidase [Methanosarcina hadiensis]|uniref:SOS response-associated peptidase n=1 Tax=Methanosarcina hadiensis TaxID=3078083 RepID=UPI0039777F1A